MTKEAVGTRAAWVLDLESDVVVAAASDDQARRLGRMLEAVGFRRLLGYLAGGVPAWTYGGLGVETTTALDIAGLAERLKRGDVTLVDVREDDEWNETHVPGSVHVPYHDLRDEVPAELRDAGKPVVAVACSAGNRSSIAASLLRRAGVENVVHLADGGIADLAAEGIELVRTGDAAER